MQGVGHALYRGVGHIGRDDGGGAQPHQRKRLRAPQPQRPLAHDHAQARALERAHLGHRARERFIVVRPLERQDERRRFAAPRRVQRLRDRLHFFPGVPRFHRRRERAPHADHAIDRRERLLQAAQRLGRRRLRLRAWQPQLESLASARAFGAEPVPHLEERAAGGGSRECEPGEVLAQTPQRQVFARRLGRRREEREHGVLVRRRPFGIALGSLCRGARVGDEEERVRFVDHDERLARRHVPLELRDQALHAQAKEMLGRLRRDLADRELPRLERRVQRVAGEPRLAQQDARRGGRDERAGLP